MKKATRKEMIIELNIDLDDINQFLEGIEEFINKTEFNVSDGFGTWNENKKAINKVIANSKELWTNKTYIEDKIKALEQTELEI